MCLKGHLVVPYAVITDVSVRSFDDVRPELGWRVGGGYWPGLLATGHYTRPGRPGERQFWRVYRRRDRLLVLETSWSSPSRIVLAVPDVDGVVAELGRHVPVRPT